MTKVKTVRAAVLKVKPDADEHQVVAWLNDVIRRIQAGEAGTEYTHLQTQTQEG